MKQFRAFKSMVFVHALATGVLGIGYIVATTERALSADSISKLGDLSSFRKIVLDTKSLADQSDLVAAKARIKDLETSWDEA